MGVGKYDPAVVFAGYRMAAVAVADTGREVYDEPDPVEPVEIGVTVVDGGTVGATHTWLVRPSRPITVWATRAHGITDTEVADAPRPAEVAGQIGEVLSDRLVVAARATHHHAMLAAMLPGWCPPRLVDLARASVLVWPWSSQALGALTIQARVSVAGRLGRVGHDAPATAAVFLAVARRYLSLGAGRSAEHVLRPATVRDNRDDRSAVRAGAVDGQPR